MVLFYVLDEACEQFLFPNISECAFHHQQAGFFKKRKYLINNYSWAIIVAHVLHIMSRVGFSLLISYNSWINHWFRFSLYNKCHKHTPIFLGTHSYFMWKRNHCENKQSNEPSKWTITKPWTTKDTVLVVQRYTLKMDILFENGDPMQIPLQ